MLSGKVVQKSNHSALEFATVTLINTESQELITGTTTDEAGLFSLKISSGTYDIKVEFLSFKTLVFENQNISADLEMSLIELEPDLTQLEAIEVVGERSTIEYKLDKKVFNVGKDLLTKGGNAGNLLGHVPSVSVDAGGNVSLRGSTNVRILVNGKPSAMTANKGLEQLPADAVQQVEVITNPSARYQSSGTAGIINIILKKNKTGGFGGSVELTTGTPANHMANINMNYKTEKINVFSNIGYRYANFFGERERNQSFMRNDASITLIQSTEQERNDDHYNIYVGSDYYINDKNTLTMSFYHNKLVNTDRTDIDYEYAGSDGTIDSTLTQVERYREPQNFNELELNYVKIFNKKDQKFTTNIVYDFWDDDENEHISLSHTFPTKSQTIINTRDIESSKDLLIQADFVTPLSETARVEAGVRGEIRTISSDYSASINQELLSAYNNLLDYNEQIYGAYMQYGNAIKKFNYLLGLRVEHSDIGIEDRKNSFTNDKKYTNLFPTAHFTYNFKEGFNMQLSYSRRINRPHFWQLNPFGGLSDTRNLFVGNPDVNPSYANSFELGLLKRWDKVTFNPSIYYRHNTLFFQYVTDIIDDAVVTKPVNLDYENNYGFEISTTYSPADWLRLSTEFNYFQYDQVGDYQGVNFDTKDERWSARISSNFRFGKGLSMQGRFQFQSANQSGQSHVKSQHGLDFGISKDVLGDKGNVSLNFRNILDSQVERETVTGANYQLYSEGKRYGRRISATFTYRFNRNKNERDRRGN